MMSAAAADDDAAAQPLDITMLIADADAEDAAASEAMPRRYHC